MRAFSFVICLALLASSAGQASAATISEQDAVSRAISAGYSLISKADAVPGAWDIWASKDGIPYEVKIDANDGSLLQASPMEAND